MFPHQDFTEHMLSVLLEVYNGIDPKFDACIRSGIKTKSNPLLYIIELKKEFNAHWNNLNHILMRGKQGEHAQSDVSLQDLSKLFFSPFKSHVKILISRKILKKVNKSFPHIRRLRGMASSRGKFSLERSLLALPPQKTF